MQIKALDTRFYLIIYNMCNCEHFFAILTTIFSLKDYIIKQMRVNNFVLIFLIDTICEGFLPSETENHQTAVESIKGEVTNKRDLNLHFDKHFNPGDIK